MYLLVEMYLYLCVCIFVYLGTYGVESCATWAAVSSSWQLAELATAVAAQGGGKLHICSRNREMTRNLFGFLKYCHVYFLDSVNHISLFLKLAELATAVTFEWGGKLYSRTQEMMRNDKNIWELMRSEG